MSNKLRSFITVLVSIVVVMAALPLRALTVNANTYTITYSANDGTANSKTVNIDSGESDTADYTVENNTFSGPQDTHFLFWSTDADGKNSNNIYKSGSTMSVSGNVTLYAIWGYTITYFSDDGRNKEYTDDVLSGANVVLENRFEADGKTLVGWSDTSKGSKVYDAGASVEINSDLSLYAKWKENEISFHENGGTGTMDDQVVYSGVSTTISPNSFIAPDQTKSFVGWTEDPESDTISYADQASITLTSDKDLYAKWAETCVITFDENGGSGTYYEQTVGIGLNTPLISNKYTYANHKFLGWADSADGEVKYFDGGLIKPEANQTTMTLYAKWAETCTIVFQASDATSGSMENMVVIKDEKITLPDNKYVKDGYRFDGWTSDTDPAQTFSNGQSGVSFSIDNVTLTAKWVQQYTVTFVNKDGAELYCYKEDVNKKPVYKGDNPTITPTAQYSYSFSGWDPAIEDTTTVTADTTYTAQYEESLRSYTITFAVDGVSHQQIFNYGDKPVYSGNPSKAADAQYTYTFDGWSPEIDETTTVTGTASYTAQFKQTLNKYSVTFVDDDGTILKEAKEYDYGTAAADIEKPDDPTKAVTAQYTYYFTGWDSAVADVTGDAIYTATYSNVVNPYNITFVDDDGTILKEAKEYDYGTAAADIEKPTDPTKVATAQYTYQFDGWDPEVTEVTGDATYTATYSSTVNTYTVKFLDEDGTELQKIEDIEYGKTPVFTNDTPTKEATAQYTYSFAGWDTPIVSVRGDAIYKATYSRTVNTYTVKFLDEDGTELQKIEDIEYGKTPVFTNDTPTKEATAQYTYSFAGWDTPIVSVSGDATYKATYSSDVNKYTVTYKNDDGTILQEGEFPWGSTASYQHMVKPTKKPTAQYTYTFAGWDNNVTLVTKDVTYTATYTSTVNKYKITFANEDGTVLQTSEVEYGKFPVYEKGTPTKAATVEETFTFAGWDKDISKVTGDTVYTARYTSTATTRDTVNYKHFTVTFVSNGGSEVVSQLVAEGGVAFRPEEPLRERYTFGGWYIDAALTKPFSFATVITSDITLYAKWIKGSPDIQATYAVIGLGSTTVDLSSVEDITVAVERSQDNDSIATHFKGVMIDGVEVDYYNYELTEDNSAVIIRADAFEGLEAGTHTIMIVYDDGTAEVELIVNDANEPTDPVEEVTETEAAAAAPEPAQITVEKASNLGLWIALGIVAAVVIAAIPIFIIKGRSLK